MKNKCNDCKHKSEEDRYDLQVCIRCENNPYMIADRFEAKEIEIRPEKAGELWESPSAAHFLTCERDGILYFVTNTASHKCFANEDILGSFTEWTRLFPPVEDENIERIEIEGVKWCKDIGYIFPYQDSSFQEWETLLDKPSMKMTLEYEKDKP